MADSFELKAIITAVDRLSAPLKGMQRQLKGFQKELSGLAVGAGATGTAILGALAGATMQAVDFEKSMADVRKVVDGLESPEAFRQMQDDILNLSAKIPLAATEIADIVAQAGQSGIKRSELSQFAEDAAKIGVAWDLSGQEAGRTLAVWRTAFGLTQKEVVELADKVNYLGNTGPANAASIAKVVTELGGISQSAHVASGDVAALASTIIGVGINGDVAKTGIKNFISGLTGVSTGDQRKVAKALGFTPATLAKSMIQDSRGTMLKVLEGVRKMAPYKQNRIMEILFGKESAEAIVPLLTNLDTLKANFNKVSDAQLYSGAAANEYVIASDTAAADLARMKNQVTQITVEIGREFLPVIRDAAKEFMPLLKTFSQFIKDNPEAVRAAAKFGVALLGVSASIGAISQAVKIMNFAMKMSPAKLLIGALVLGAYEIIEHWDEVGPVIKKVWQEVDNVAQELGGWENVIEGVGAVMAGSFAIKTLGSLREAVALAGALSGTLGKIGKMGAMTVTIAIAVSMLQALKELETDAKAAGESSGAFAMHKMQAKERERGYYGFGERAKEIWASITGQDYTPPIPDGRYSPNVGLSRPVGGRSQSELTVTFENAPPGMRVIDPKSGDPFMSVKTDVAYSPFRTPG
ncbi:phage tail tape measure protein [Cronobacter sakazakii]|uniref:phage tail tape measure protein n=1 Tax=Cronobacter sakazakii TaxID=28141 RepID=UPI000A19789F|nr:phage tail tape measure protein [Cronobacter sakazakii]ELY4122404.1 phage tail tape measure protein [Cronobacter sakazakii]ELY5994558.1 phage tail tape measure protein [Cronobacter sakazakii]PRC66824.1 phage tail tape measure protein [Cronobacter sakazakii]